MAQAVAMPMPRVGERAAAIPWYVWCSVLATTSSMIGIHWDISWHRSIGRDTFWTPAHIAIYMCGVLAGISCGYLILHTTFSSAAGEMRQSSVKLWGFRGPLGAFIAAWGGIAMLTSGPFDDWWHGAYGLDVKIISPPHMVLALGMFSVQLGALLLVLGWMNRASGASRRTLQWLYLYVGGLLVANMATLILEYTFRVNMHSAIYYRAIGLALPLFFFAVAGSAGVPWAATKVATVYMIFWQSMNLILPLFPAEPKLGPVNNPVTHFVPSFFPLLLVIPALAVDWLLARARNWPAWRTGLVAGLAFMGVLLAVQWPFGDFLLSPASRNWFFYTHLHDYRTGPNSLSARHIFLHWEKTAAEFRFNLGIAFAASALLATAGLYWAQWLRRVRR